MKAKGISSEMDAKDKLIVYVYEYLSRSGANRAAQAFLEDIRYEKAVTLEQKEGPGFLANWWCVFWDLYCAAPDKRNNNQIEPTSEARAFVEYSMRPIMSPHHQTSPPQPPQPYMQPGPRGPPGYGLPPPTAQQGIPMRHGPPQPMNAGPPRMQMGQPMMPPQMMVGGPPMQHSHGPPMPSGPMGPSGPPPQPVGMPSHSPMPHPGPPQPVGMPSHSPMPHPGPPPPPNMQHRGGPVGEGGGGNGGWQGGYGSPAEQCFMPGPPGSGENNTPTTPHQEDYVMPGGYGGDAGSEIRKLKESLENDADQSGFSMDFKDPNWQ